jgi:ubiquinone/menaquinone biosynthesis C-methylase UbiE
MNQAVKKQAITDYESAYSAVDFEVIQAKYRKKLLIETLNTYQPKHVLEVGCGLDTIAKHWGQFEQFTIVEPGANFAQKARQATHDQQNTQVIEGFLEDEVANLRPVFDLVLLSSLLHEVPDVQVFLAGVQSICSDETVIHINVPNAKSLHRILALEMQMIDSVFETSAMQKMYQQTRIYDLDTLTSEIEKAGYEVISKGSFFMKPFTHGQMHALLQNNIVGNEVLDGLWNLTKHFPDNGSEIYMNVRRKKDSS